MSRIVSFVLKQAWRRGVLGGNATWVVLGGVALLVRAGRKALKRSEDVVYHEQLSPGQRLVITHEAPPA